MTESKRGKFGTGAFFLQAAPMIVTRAGLAAMGIADGIMVARYQAHEFAWLSLAEGTLGRLLDVCVAFLIGGLSLVPRHFGRGDAVGARQIWLRTLLPSIALGATGLLLGLIGSRILALLGQSPALSDGAGPVMAILGAGYPAALLAMAAGIYLEGVRRPRVVAVSIVAANLANIALNWMLIGGRWGFPAMGAEGSAWSTTTVRIALAVALVACAWRSRTGTAAPAVPALPQHDAEQALSRKAQWRLGLGAAGTVAAMVVLTASLTIFAGWMGVLPLAAFSAAWNLATPAILIALGLADAAGIEVAAAAGSGGERRAATVVWSRLRLTLVPTAALAACLALGAKTLVGLYTQDVSLQLAMAAVVPIVALIVVTDSAGFVMAASLRAFRDVAWLSGIEIGSMLLLVPLAAGLALWRGLGVSGLFYAMLAVAVARAAMLIWRFRRRLAASRAPLGAPE